MKRLPSWRFEPLAACQRNKGVCPSSEYMLWCGSNNGGNLILICTFNIRNFLRKTTEPPLRHVERGQRLQLLRVCGCQVREVFISVCVSWSLLHVNQPRSEGFYIPIPSSLFPLGWANKKPRESTLTSSAAEVETPSVNILTSPNGELELPRIQLDFANTKMYLVEIVECKTGIYNTVAHKGHAAN